MTAPPNEDPLMVVAVELLRKLVADLPLAVAMNADRGKPPAPMPGGAGSPHLADASDVPAFDRPQAVVVMGPKPLPVTAQAQQSGQGPDADTPGRFNRELRRGSQALAAFGLRFGALLGPIAAVTTYLTAQTSGFQVFNSAIQLFASAVGQVLMPVFFALAVGLATASELVAKKFGPALESYTRAILDVALPAVIQLAQAAASAAQALVFIADSDYGRAVATTADVTVGDRGIVGGTARNLERLGSLAGGEDPDKGKTFWGRAGSIAGDTARMVPIVGGPAVAAKNWLMNKIGFDDEPASARGPSGETAAAARRAKEDTLREMIFQMNPRAGVGSLRGAWAQAQTAHVAMSPFQQRTLQMMTDILAALSRAALEPPRGEYTGVAGWIADAPRRAGLGGA